VIRHVETYPLSSHSVSLTPSTILRAQGVRRPAAEAQGVRQLAAEARALQRAAQAWQVWPGQASAYLFRAGLARPRSPMPIPRAPAEPTTLQREGVFREMKLRGEAWIIDDTSFPKRGRHSVGVARQYCGQLGKEDNCQVAVSLSLANAHASLPVSYRLYLPQEWTSDRARLQKAGVPADIGFQTKHEIALHQLRWACAAGLPRGVVLMDAAYGNNSDLRADVTALGLTYVAGILSNTTVWAAGTGPLPAKKWSGRGRPPKLLQRDAKHKPVSVKELALGLPKRAWRTIEWREGTAESLALALCLRACLRRAA